MSLMDMEKILSFNMIYKGNYIRHFAGRGEGDQYVVNAHGICIDNRDKKIPALL